MASTLEKPDCSAGCTVKTAEAPHGKNGTAFLLRGIIETVWIHAEPLSLRANENLTQL